MGGDGERGGWEAEEEVRWGGGGGCPGNGWRGGPEGRGEGDGRGGKEELGEVGKGRSRVQGKAGHPS